MVERGGLVECITGHGRGRIVQCHKPPARLADRQHPPHHQSGRVGVQLLRAALAGCDEVDAGDVGVSAGLEVFHGFVLHLGVDRE